MRFRHLSNHGNKPCAPLVRGKPRALSLRRERPLSENSRQLSRLRSQPLAVMAARTNYLIAIRDLIGHVDKIEIPVYLCDSILTPAEYGGLAVAALGKAMELKTAVGVFVIPSEIANDPDHVAKYAEQLES